MQARELRMSHDADEPAKYHIFRQVLGMRRPICLVYLALVSAATPAELLNSFRSSAVQSAYGKVSEIAFSSGFVELESGALAHHVPYAMKDFQFPERVWVIGYRTEILDRQGKNPRENYLCHTFMADQRVAQHNDNELLGIYSDAFTPEVRLPEGFGIRLSAGERLHWMPMFNNRTHESVRIEMKVVVTLIRDRDLKQPLKPLYASLRSVQVPHLFFVEPGKDERQTAFTLPFDGTIHFLGTHIHPYGASVELFNVSRNELVWKGKREKQPDGPMQVYSSGDGYRFRAGETYRITSVYENTNKDRIDAMAGLFMLYSRD
jgi:hypothetical protein